MITNISARFIILLIVIASYGFFVFPNVSYENFSRTPTSHYQYLTAGFLSGHLSLSVLPSNALLQLNEPYDPKQNKRLRLHDASLFNGKYYLYFGTLPALTFFMPIKVLTGWYLPEALCVFFFLSIGFMAGFFLLIKIKEQHFPTLPESQVLFAGLILGFANNAPFLLTRPVFYEAAISSAFCLMTIALLFLYRCCNNTFKCRDAFLFSLCLSLSVAGRPHLALVCIFLISAVCFYLCNYSAPRQAKKCIVAIAIPAACTALALGLYNYLRFDSIWEFGQNYQLAAINATQTGLFDTATLHQHFLYGLFYYFLQPYTIHSSLPYFYLQYSAIPVPQHYFLGPTAGILTTAPFLLLCLALPCLIHFHRGNQKVRPLLWFASAASFVPLIIILFLISLAGAIQRYETDFVPYLIILSIISLWLLEEAGINALRMRIINLFFSITGTMSILIGISLGLHSWSWWLVHLSQSYIHFGSTSIEIKWNQIILFTLAMSLIYFVIKRAMPR